jgi:hypothetical protein
LKLIFIITTFKIQLLSVTILNEVFGTTFKVMKPEKEKTQTAKGVWRSDAETQSLQSSHFLILNIEGLDSMEKQGEGGV